jgi:ribose transport system permease protein
MARMERMATREELAPAPGRATGAAENFGRLRRLGSDALLAPGVLPLIAWLALVTWLASRLPFFLTIPNALTILNFSAVTFVAAAGFTLALIGGMLDLSVGSTMMASGVVAGLLFLGGVPLPLAFMAGLVIGALVGVVNGLLVTRMRINPLVATLSTLFVVRGLGYLATDGQVKLVRDQGFRFARDTLLGVPVPVYILAVVALLTFALLYLTRFGRHLYAIGGNPGAARQAVMDVDWYRRVMYVVAGAYSGVAGVLLASLLGSADPSAGTGREFDVATAVFIGGASLSGGRGSVFGTLIGVLFVQTLTNGLIQMAVIPEAVLMIEGLLLIAAVAFDQRPRGGYK